MHELSKPLNKLLDNMNDEVIKMPNVAVLFAVHCGQQISSFNVLLRTRLVVKVISLWDKDF